MGLVFCVQNKTCAAVTAANQKKNIYCEMLHLRADRLLLFIYFNFVSDFCFAVSVSF